MLIVSLTDIWFVSRYICLIHRLLDDTEIISGYVSWYVDCYLLCKYLADRSRVTCFRQSIRAFSSAQCQKVTFFWVIYNYRHSANLNLSWGYSTHYLWDETYTIRERGYLLIFVNHFHLCLYVRRDFVCHLTYKPHE